MVKGRSQRRRVSGAMILIVVGLAASVAAQPSVEAGARPAGGSWTIQTTARPAAPLVATASAGSGDTQAWANVQPGRMRASASSATSVGEYLSSMAYATSVDHFHLYRPGLPANTPGDFLYNFYLSGTMKVSASTPTYTTSARVSVYGNTTYYGADSGMLFFERIGTQAVLYAQADPSGGGSYPETNMFAGPDGERVIYGTVNAPVAGFYTIYVRLPARFVFRAFPCNQSPLVDNWYNRIEFGLQCGASTGSLSDFSATFEFTEQNPIVPDPDDADLPRDGWTFTTGSGEITLASPLTVDCATGTGAAYFRAADGLIANLTALDGASLPAAGRPDGFTHGFFSLDVTGLTAGATTMLTVTVPTAMPGGTHWWFTDGVGWLPLQTTDDDGDVVLQVKLVDGGRGDTDATNGAVRLVGGLTAAASPQPVWLGAFAATMRGDGVDLSWRAESAAAAGFALTARLGGREWSVPYAALGDGAFAARDENGALAGGGSVVYELSYEGQLLDRRTVALATPDLPAVLIGAAPNPFNPQTRITFRLSAAQRVRLGVYDLGGRQIAVIADSYYSPGRHAVEWNGLDAAGRAMPSGSYVARLLAEGPPQSRLISLVR